MTDTRSRVERREFLKLSVAAGIAATTVGVHTARAQDNPNVGEPVSDAPLGVRRVITGHDENGHAMVAIDEMRSFQHRRRANHAGTDVWSTATQPPDINATGDFGEVLAENARANGTICRVTRYGVGVAPRPHRTESLDYVFILSGSIDMEMDEGRVVRLNQGDVLVQRGTMHNWVNPGPDPCIVAFVLIGSNAVEVNGMTLGNQG